MKTNELQGSVTLDLTQSPKTPEDIATFTATAKALQVIDDESYRIASEMCQKEARWHASVESFYEEGRELAYRSWKWFTTRIAKHKEEYEARKYLEPRMKQYRIAQERAKHEAELARQREEEERKRRADEEARAIQAKAEADALALRKAGDVREARRVQEEAAAQAQEIQAAAETIETILPDNRPVGGPGESRPWTARVTNPKLFIQAVAAGKVDLMHMVPVRTKNPVTGKFESVDTPTPILEINMTILNEIAKRLGGEQAPAGICFERSLSLRFSKNGDPGPSEPRGWD